MFSENFHTLRKTKGYSQEELAIRLNVVRQTISKWEKGISAPDADMLTRIADIFEVSVSELVEEKIETELESDPIVEQMSRINEQLIISNRRSLRMWKSVAIFLIAFVSVGIAGLAVGVSAQLVNADNAPALSAGYADSFLTVTVVATDQEPTPDTNQEPTPAPYYVVDDDNIFIAFTDQSGVIHVLRSAEIIRSGYTAVHPDGDTVYIVGEIVVDGKVAKEQWFEELDENE